MAVGVLKPDMVQRTVNPDLKQLLSSSPIPESKSSSLRVSFMKSLHWKVKCTSTKMLAVMIIGFRRNTERMNKRKQTRTR